MIPLSPANSPSPNPAPGSAVTTAAGLGAGQSWSHFIAGAPIAKKRPRFTTINGHARAFNAQITEEGRLRLELMAAWGQRAPLAGPVWMVLTFAMPIPSSVSKKAQAQMAANVVRHTKKPDLDNLVKLFKDCANGVIWVDDCQVVEIRASKFYSDTPGTNVTVRGF